MSSRKQSVRTSWHSTIAVRDLILQASPFSCRSIVALAVSSGTLISTFFQSAYAQAIFTAPNPTDIEGVPALTEDAEAPKIATAGSNVYIVWHEFDMAGGQPDVYLSRSTNRGRTFGSRQNLSNTSMTSSSDEDIAVSGNNVFVVWSENGQNILISRSTSGGARNSFTTLPQLNTTAGAVTPQVAVSGNNVFVVWSAGGDIYFAESSNQGRTFIRENNISRHADDPVCPGAAVPCDAIDPDIRVSGNRLIVTWRDNRLPRVGLPSAGYEIFVAGRRM